MCSLTTHWWQTQCLVYGLLQPRSYLGTSDSQHTLQGKYGDDKQWALPLWRACHGSA